jgi:hypothetical protein
MHLHTVIFFIFLYIFEKIEKIASALQIASYQLFMEEFNDIHENQELKTKDYLNELPKNVKKEITSHMLATIQQNIMESLDSKNY